MHGSQLKALLKTLREAGVTRYSTPDLSIELGAAPAPRAAAPDLTPDEVAEIVDDEAEKDGITDWRFALERLGPPNFARERKPTPRKRPA